MKEHLIENGICKPSGYSATCYKVVPNIRHVGQFHAPGYECGYLTDKFVFEAARD